MSNRYRTIVVILVLGLLPLGQLPSPTAHAKVVDQPFEGPDGLLWADPVQVTDNDFDDQFASVRVDGEGTVDIVYLQSGAEYMLAKLVPPGDVITTDKRLLTGFIPTQYQVKNESTPQPTDFFDIGPDGSIHVVWTEAGLLDNRYRRFDPTGEPMGQVIHMNQIVSLSRLPYIVVGSNGRAYIAFENEGSAWVQMTFVDDEGYIRSPKLIGRPGENVAYSKGPGDVLHLFYRSLGADVSMFHVKLDPDRRPLVPTDVLFPNTSKVANPFSSMPISTVTPDGHVHLLLSETTVAPHPIHYFELDETGTQVLREMRVVEAAHNYGDVVGDPDNNVYIFWDDAGDGEVHYLKITDGVPGEEAAVSSTGGRARYPQVMTSGERGDMHLTYIDGSDGDGEVVYRYANSYRIDLQVEGVEDAVEVHPGTEVVDLEVVVSNIGEVSNEVTVTATVDYNGLEAQGWSFDMDDWTGVLDGGGTHSIGATLTGPFTGTEGENISVTVSAVPKRSMAKATTVSFSSTLTITHALRVSGPSAMALDDILTAIPLGVSDQGDVPEDVNITVTGGLPGWNVSLGVTNATLLPGAAPLELLLNITLPVWELEDIVARLTVTAVTSSVPVAMTKHDITVVTYPTVFPELFPVNAYDVVTPGEKRVRTVRLRNDGSESAVFDLAPLVHRAEGEWDIDVQPRVLEVGAGAEGGFNITAVAPGLALAGPGLKLEVLAVERTTHIGASFMFNVMVEEVISLRVEGGGVATVAPGETAIFDATIENKGNSYREVELSVLTLPPGWSWRYGRDQGISSLVLDPLSSTQVAWLVTPSMDAPPGEVAVEGTVDDSGELHHFNARVTVLQAYGVLVDSKVPITKAELGSQATLRFSVTNTGTSLERFTLVARDLPVHASAQFLVNGSLASDVSVLPGGTAEVTILLELPSNMKGRDFGFLAGVVSEARQVALVELHVEFRLPDLKVKDVLFDNKGLRHGDKRKVTVRVGNIGDADAEAVIVNVNGRTRTVSVPAGGEGNVTIDVVFDQHDGKLVVVVDPDNSNQERREDNNAYFHELDVQGTGAGIPGFELMTGILAIVSIFLFISCRKD